MKLPKLLRLLVGVLLVSSGFLLSFHNSSQVRTISISQDGCTLVTDLYAPRDLDPKGAVILLHGLAATKRIMSYLAEGFTNQGLLVVIPDLPGHGRSPGPFSPARAETCSTALVKNLAGRGLIDPTRTILAGHSMGGAIAIRIAARTPVAGVIAISPAPMKSARGIWPEMLLYQDPKPLPQNSLIINGAWEPASLRLAARDLVSNDGRGSTYMTLSHATHVSLLFDPATVASAQSWTSHILHLAPGPTWPSRLPLLAFVLGLGGITALAAPFLRETIGNPDKPLKVATSGSLPRLAVEFALLSLLAVFLLRLGTPLRFLGVFEGDYFASFLFLVGIGLLLLHRGSLTSTFKPEVHSLGLSAFAALVLLLLILAWSDHSFSEAWLTVPRWLRFAPYLLAVLPIHIAEECALPPLPGFTSFRGMLIAMAFRGLAWGALLFGLFVLHSGQILLLLLAVYFFLFSVLQRLGMDVVRNHTGSVAASSLFGAILHTGFCLAIFPVA